ncbi:zinc knuckle CX2CX4HX4C containing protein [Tanacetum coccineum]
MFVPTGSTLPTLQTAKDLQGDELLHYDAEIELMNLILLSIPNEIYNSVDACTTAKEMWKIVERLTRGTIQNQVDRETRFTYEFDQFVAEREEALVSVYNRFARLMNDLERNKMIFLIFTVNTKFLNNLQPEWLKYVTQVRLAKRFDSIQVENIIPSKSKPSDPIIQSMVISTKATSYARVAGASAKDQQKVNYNFRSLMADPIFEGVNISIPRKVVEKCYYAKNNLAKTWLKMIMMNTKGFFFFKFDTQAGLEAVLQGGPWMIRNSLIILKKWSMDTRLLKKELTRILIWVKLHDVPIQVFEEDGLSLIAMFIGKPVMLDSLHIFHVDGFTKETICVEYKWRPPKCDLCKIFGHVHDHFPKKVVCPPIITTSNVFTPVVEKTNDGFQTVGKKKKRKGKSRTAGTSFKKDNITMSNSYSAFNDEEEDEENMYDESANLFPKTKTSGSSYFTAAIGYLVSEYICSSCN